MIEVVDDDYVFFFARVVTFSYMESSVAIGSAFSYPRDLREANGSIPFLLGFFRSFVGCRCIFFIRRTSRHRDILFSSFGRSLLF